MTTESDAMAKFARRRLQEDLLTASAAPQVRLPDDPRGIAYVLNAALVRRFDAARIRDDITRKLTVVTDEKARATQAEQENTPAYTLPHLRALVRLWQDHPDFDPTWATLRHELHHQTAGFPRRLEAWASRDCFQT